MKVIFLDVDGVLTHNSYVNWQTRHIDPVKVELLRKMKSQTGAIIVLTSTWKDGYDKKEEAKEDYYVILENALAEYGLEIYDITDDIPEEIIEDIPPVITLDEMDFHCKHGTGRAAEVQKWIKEHPVENFVILDDEDHDWSDYGFESHWIRTSWYDPDGGIQEKNVAEAVQILENGTRKIGRG